MRIVIETDRIHAYLVLPSGSKIPIDEEIEIRCGFCAGTHTLNAIRNAPCLHGEGIESEMVERRRS